MLLSLFPDFRGWNRLLLPEGRGSSKQKNTAEFVITLLNRVPVETSQTCCGQFGAVALSIKGFIWQLLQKSKWTHWSPLNQTNWTHLEFLSHTLRGMWLSHPALFVRNSRLVNQAVRTWINVLRSLNLILINPVCSCTLVRLWIIVKAPVLLQIIKWSTVLLLLLKKLLIIDVWTHKPSRCWHLDGFENN